MGSIHRCRPTHPGIELRMELFFDWLRGLRLKLKTLVRPDAAWHALDDELRFHVEMETDRLMRAGRSPAQARREAMIRFGGVDRYVSVLHPASDKPGHSHR